VYGVFGEILNLSGDSFPSSLKQATFQVIDPQIEDHIFAMFDDTKLFIENNLT
jgi:hypothetical protein